MKKIIFLKKFNFLVKALNHSYDFWIRWSWFDEERKELFLKLKEITWVRLKKKEDVVRTLYNLDDFLINFKEIEVKKIKVKDKTKWIVKTFETLTIADNSWYEIKMHTPKITQNIKNVINVDILEDFKEEKMKKIKGNNSNSKNKNIQKIQEEYSDFEKEGSMVYTKQKYSQAELNNFIKDNISILLKYLQKFIWKNNVQHLVVRK